MGGFYELYLAMLFDWPFGTIIGIPLLVACFLGLVFLMLAISMALKAKI